MIRYHTGVSVRSSLVFLSLFSERVGPDVLIMHYDHAIRHHNNIAHFFMPSFSCQEKTGQHIVKSKKA